MRKSKFTEERIAFALRQVEGGTAVEQVCRKMGVSEATLYSWKKQFGGMGVVELRRPASGQTAENSLRQFSVPLLLTGLLSASSSPYPPCGVGVEWQERGGGKARDFRR